MFRQWGHCIQGLMWIVKTYSFFFHLHRLLSQCSATIQRYLTILKHFFHLETSRNFQASPVILQRTYIFMENLWFPANGSFTEAVAYEANTKEQLSVILQWHHIIVISVYANRITYLAHRYDEAQRIRNGKKIQVLYRDVVSKTDIFRVHKYCCVVARI